MMVNSNIIFSFIFKVVSSKKRPNQSAVKTPVSVKKAKSDSAQKSGEFQLLIFPENLANYIGSSENIIHALQMVRRVLILQRLTLPRMLERPLERLTKEKLRHQSLVASSPANHAPSKI